MKKLIFLLACLVVLGPVAVQSQQEYDFNGEWDWLQSPPDKSFYIKLQHVGNRIIGSYCATAFNGSRVDCGFDEGACPIVGETNGSIANVEFTSCYGKQKGKARLIHKGDKIEWMIIDVPFGPWYFCPRQAILEKSLKIWKSLP